MNKKTQQVLPFPPIPNGWSPEGHQFAVGLRSLLDQIQTRGWQRAWPVGSVALTATDERPFAFGEWESVQTGMTGIYGWKRVR